MAGIVYSDSSHICANFIAYVIRLLLISLISHGYCGSATSLIIRLFK